MNKIVLMVISLSLLSSLSYADNQNQASNINTADAKEQYRIFLQKLKELNSQYKVFTGEVSQVIKEEGMPSWDMGAAASTPSMDGVTVTDMNQEILVTLELPGIQKRTLKITSREGNLLIVRAEKKARAETKIIEKIIPLPSTVDAKSARAKYVDGVLTIHLAKITPQEVVIPVK